MMLGALFAQRQDEEAAHHFAATVHGAIEDVVFTHAQFC